MSKSYNMQIRFVLGEMHTLTTHILSSGWTSKNKKRKRSSKYKLKKHKMKYVKAFKYICNSERWTGISIEFEVRCAFNSFISFQMKRNEMKRQQNETLARVHIWREQKTRRNSMDSIQPKINLKQETKEHFSLSYSITAFRICVHVSWLVGWSALYSKF